MTFFFFFCYETSQIKSGTVKSAYLIKKGSFFSVGVWAARQQGTQTSYPSAILDLQELNVE